MFACATATDAQLAQSMRHSGLHSPCAKTARIWPAEPQTSCSHNQHPCPLLASPQSSLDVRNGTRMVCNTLGVIRTHTHNKTLIDKAKLAK